MSVWKSDETLLSSQKYSAARRIFNSLLGVSSGDETLHLMFDILQEKQMKDIANYFVMGLFR